MTTAGEDVKAMKLYAGPKSTATVESMASNRLDATEGNELLTIATASVLVLLLAAEGITLLKMDTLLSVHMVIGLVLIPPVLLKIGSTGYRFARYYTHSRTYVAKGPPALPLRVLAPVLVVTTIGIFVTGILLLALGHKSDQLVLLHKVFFIVWAGVFGIHFLAYLPRMLSCLASGWRGTRPEAVPGAGLRAMLVAASLGAGAALAISLLGAISGWHGGHSG